jgi:amphi-Trp domain-containing protein
MANRDVEKEYSNGETIQKLERLVECMKNGQPYEIQVAGERIYVPVRATFTIEHEVEGNEEELEFQFKWQRER